MQEVSEIKHILSQIPDPEIPVITIEELGILRNCYYDTTQKLIIEVMPTYSGCPAIDPVIDDIKNKLIAQGIDCFEVKQVFTPAWTTDFLSEATKQKMKAYGIAPPGVRHHQNKLYDDVSCPRCASIQVNLVSAFGSTACKALFKCQECLEPFEYFKCF